MCRTVLLVYIGATKLQLDGVPQFVSDVSETDLLDAPVNANGRLWGANGEADAVI